MTPGTSVVARKEKTNATPWKSAAEAAARQALRRVGEPHADLLWRQARLDGSRPWAAFDVPATGDVLWVAQEDGAAPAATMAVSTEFGEMGVWRYPHDPALPGLSRAVTPGALSMTLADVAPEVDADEVQVIALWPRERAVVRMGGAAPGVYLKVIPPWRVVEVADRHRRASDGGLPAPAVLHVDEAWGVIVFEELAGTPLATHLEMGHPAPHPAALWHFVEQIGRVMGSHGDLHDRQLLVDDRGDLTGVVDLDDAGTCDLVDDLGRLLGHIALRGETHPEQQPRIEQLLQELLAEFSRHVDGHRLLHRMTRTTERLRQFIQTAGS